MFEARLKLFGSGSIREIDHDVEVGDCMKGVFRGGGRIPDVTASVVTYKTSGDELANLLRCAAASLIPENICVVDNSPDKTLRACAESFGASYLWTGRNIGFGAAHNRALEMHKDRSRYHLMTNPDIVFGCDLIPELYEFMERHPDVGQVMPRVTYPDGSEQRLCKQFPSPVDLFARRFPGPFGERLLARRMEQYELRNVDMNVIRQIPCLSGCFMFVRMSAIREIGTFDERYFMYMEDVDFCRRIGRRYKTAFYPHVSVVHGYAKGSYRNLRNLYFHVLSAIRYFTKWGWIHDPERKQLNGRTDPLISEEKAA